VHRIRATAIGLAIQLLTVKTVAAQAAGLDTLFGCYVPSSGTMYRTKATNAPNTCAAALHVAFSFNMKGPQGDLGPTGASGPAGPKGEAGVSGAVGATGAAGSAGADGATGPTGAVGATGPIGPVGIQGPAGPAGPTGAAGPQGEPGVRDTIAYWLTDYSIVTATYTVASGGSTGRLFAFCPASHRAMGGGWTFSPFNYDASVTTSAPNTFGDSWAVQVITANGQGNLTLVVHATCAPIGAGRP